MVTKRSIAQWIARAFIPLYGAALLAAPPPGPSEDQVKAAFLLNFARFVTWPAATFEGASQALGICTSGDDSLESSLDETVKGKTVDQRPLAIHHIGKMRDFKGCQVVFVPAARASQVSAAPGGMPGVLTVTEQEAGSKSGSGGAIITFVTQDSRVRFKINNKAAENAGLVISSKLLRLAVSVD